MGGLGSGRWGWHRKKRAAEDCRVLDLALVVRGRTPTPGQAGTLTWSRGTEVVASVGYEVVAAAGGLAVRLGYTWTPTFPPGAAVEVTLDIRLVRGSVPNGGSRWWGVCPLATGDRACGRRVGKLYLARGCRLFGCRACHRLTYRSRQSHDKRVSRLARDPDALMRLDADPRRQSITQLGLVLQALTLVQRREERAWKRFEKKYGKRER
jgi:hypothetical protein